MIPGYAIVREVGRGGMGVVYEAVEEALGRTVALKVVAPERVREEGFRERFVAESRMAASLDHPNVLPVFGAGETEDGTLWLSMLYNNHGRAWPATIWVLPGSTHSPVTPSHESPTSWPPPEQG